MHPLRLGPMLLLLALAGCSTSYYETMEKIGVPKREILVNRVADTRQTLTEARQQFAGAQEQFLAATQVTADALPKKSEDLNDQLEKCSARAKDLREHIAGIEDVAKVLFTDWRTEYAQYPDAQKRKDSRREYNVTQRRYDTLIRLMHRSADQMDPVLASFRDQTLLLKENPNAQAIASLDSTNRLLDTNVSHLLNDLDAAIREAEAFVKDFAPPKAMTQ